MNVVNRWQKWLIWVWLAVALGVRALALGRYVTPDELVWVYRSVLFREAMLAGRWAETLVAGHPGVLTLWSGVVGVSAQLWLRPSSRPIYTWITHLVALTPDNTLAMQQLATFLTAARLVVILVNGVGLLLIVCLVRRLWGERIAMIAGWLLALEPFGAGLSGLLHVDGLMSTFATVSLLALGWLLRGEAGGKRPYLAAALSGAAAALAVVSKSPALALLPVVAVGFALAWWRDACQQGWRASLWPWLRLGVVWLAALTLVSLAVFPALWAAPGQVLTMTGGSANRHLDEALRPTFFLGTVDYQHGWLFYPLVLLFRVGPWVWLGLAVTAVLLWQRRRDWRGVGERKDFSGLLLLLWVGVFTAVLSLAAKKFDRYALPVMPALTLLAAWGWGQWGQGKWDWRRWLTVGVAVGQAIYLLTAVPYLLAAYNPLVGGGAVAGRVLPIGWGEAISAAGRWLAVAAAGDVGRETAVSSTAPSLAPFFPGRTLFAEDETVYAQANYLIVTAGEVQSGMNLPLDGFSLRHTIRYAGREQAWIYEQAQPQPELRDLTPLPEVVQFGSVVQLRAQGAAEGAAEGAEAVTLFLQWGLGQPTDGRFSLRLTLSDPDGNTWAWLETELLNEVYIYPPFWAAAEQPVLRYRLPLPAAMPPGEYTVNLTLFDQATTAQLPVLVDGRFQGMVLPLAGMTIPPATTWPPVTTLEIPYPLDTAAINGVRLLGYAPPLPSVVTGDQLTADLFWQAESPLPPGLTLTWHLGDSYTWQTPLSRYDTGQWRVGEVIHEKYVLPVPTELAGGEYELRVGIDGYVGSRYTVAQVTVVALDRLFDLPPQLEVALNYQFGDGLFLRGVDGVETAVSVGEAAHLTLYWQTSGQPDVLLTAFVHVVGPEGQPVAQSDQWPGGLPSNTWAAGQVIVDEVTLPIPAGLPAGEYPLAVGVYLAESGVRLVARDGMGTAVADDRIILPLPLVVHTQD